ncbi:MAG: DUF1269 domain-containing protein [Acidimicrobiales bacterium]|nr:DUF1269 domain-containing protein [Acidimicrobiales bacterium]
MSEVDVHGPIDFLLIQFPGDKPTDAAAAALLDLVDRGIVRLYDILAIRKDADGTFSGIELDAAGDLGGFVAFAGARSGLLGDDDLRQAGDAMDPGTMAVLLVYENAWAIPFVAGALDGGGQMIASQRIPAQDVMDALDALDAED